MNYTKNPAPRHKQSRLHTRPDTFSYGSRTRLTEQEIDSVVTQALTTFGVEAQIYMLFEEMSELQNAICKYGRGRDTQDHICEEIADVLIMLLQMSHLYGVQTVEEWANKKILRLADNIADIKEKSLEEIIAFRRVADGVYHGEEALLRPLRPKGSAQ